MIEVELVIHIGLVLFAIVDDGLGLVLPNDDIKPEELNGPCIVIQKGKRGDIE